MNIIEWNYDLNVIGTGFKGYLDSPYNFNETVARLVTLSGHEPEFPIDPDSDGKASVQFIGKFNGEVFTLYDYKRDGVLHIGGRHVDVEALSQELSKQMGSVQPTPFKAYLKYWDGYKPYSYTNEKPDKIKTMVNALKQARFELTTEGKSQKDATLVMIDEALKLAEKDSK